MPNLASAAYHRIIRNEQSVIHMLALSDLYPVASPLAAFGNWGPPSAEAHT